MMELCFSSDTKHRRQFFTGVSFSHPAKLVLPLQLWLIENYTKPGEVILDCMAGSGTLLVACSMGRHVIAIELEQKFVDMMKGNWAKIQERGPMLGYEMGTAQIIQGDARNLTGILADRIITSPPYETQAKGISQQEYDKKQAMVNKARRERGDVRGGIGRSGALGKSAINPNGYSASFDNIGNLKSDFYLAAMLQVYQNCFAVLKPGGLMILVVKPFVRNRQLVHLEEDTRKVCEQVGFIFVEQHVRKLTNMSFWRTIYYQKNPTVERVDKEYILVVRKGDVA